MSERGGAMVGFVILIVGAILVVWLAADACFDDEVGFGVVELADDDDYGDYDRDDSGDGSEDCSDSSGTCSDNDGVNADKIIVCLPDSRCEFDGEATWNQPV